MKTPRSPGAPKDTAALLHELEVHQIELEMQNEELRRAHQELEISRAQYSDLYELAPIGYLTLSDQGVILQANLRAASLLGEARGGVVGQPLTRFVIREDQDVWYRFTRELFESGGPLTREMRFTRADQPPVWAYLEAVVAAGDHGGAPVCRLVATDISQRKRSDAALSVAQRLLERSVAEIQELNDELERRVNERTIDLRAANRELETLVYTIAHDLPAPLRAISGYSGILEQEYGDRLDDEGRRLLGVARDAALGMHRLISDLLEYCHTGSGELRCGPVDMAALAREVYEGLAPEEVRTGFRFSVGALPEAWGDAALLRSVWSNLLANAVKFTLPQAGRVIEVGGGVADGQTTYWVQDSGVGFDQAYAPKLFGVFQRLHAPEDFEGTGIGLAIVRRIVARHGGKVRAEGALNAGARFTFSLPRRAGAGG